MEESHKVVISIKIQHRPISYNFVGAVGHKHLSSSEVGHGRTSLRTTVLDKQTAAQLILSLLLVWQWDFMSLSGQVWVIHQREGGVWQDEGLLLAVSCGTCTVSSQEIDWCLLSGNRRHKQDIDYDDSVCLSLFSLSPRPHQTNAASLHSTPSFWCLCADANITSLYSSLSLTLQHTHTHTHTCLPCPGMTWIAWDVGGFWLVGLGTLLPPFPRCGQFLRLLYSASCWTGQPN